MAGATTRIGDVPALPGRIAALLDLALSAPPDPGKIVSLISADSSLQQRVLKLVQTSSSEASGRIKTLDHAMEVCGPGRVCRAALPVLLGDFLLRGGFGKALDVRPFLAHSLATAHTMYSLARLMEVEGADRLFLLGLFHDMGKILLDFMPDSRYDAVLNRVKKGTPLVEAERGVFGRDSRQAWFHLARDWGFPDPFIRMCAGSIKGKVAIRTWKFAEASSRIADTLGFQLCSTPLEETPPTEFNLLSLIRSGDFLDLTRTVWDELAVYCAMFDLPPADKRHIYRVMLNIARELSTSNAGYEDLHQDLACRIEELEMLARVFTGIIKSLEGDPLTYSVLESIMEGLGVDGAFMVCLEGSSEWSGYTVGTNEQGEATVDLLRLSMDRISPSMRACIEKVRPRKIEEPGRDPGMAQCRGRVDTAWLVPTVGMGHVNALLGVGFRKGGKWAADHDMGRILEILAMEVGLSVENTRLYHKFRREAELDPLTGINNRRCILQILKSEYARFLRKGIPLAVAVFDLDHFKQINDRRGHLEGDRYLEETARILKKEVRSADHIGRYGGDEFIAIFPHTHLEEALPVVTRILEKLAAIPASERGSHLGAAFKVSVGLAAAENSMDRWDDLVKAADDALYLAKEAGGSQCMVYQKARP